MRKFEKFYNLFSLQRRFLCALLVIVICFCALTVRLFVLQIINNEGLQVKAMSQWLRDLPLSARRGDICDKNGVLLATSVTTYDVYVRARNVDKPAELASFLSQKLDKDYDSLYKKLTNVYISESLVKMQVDEDTAMEIVNSGYSGVYLSQNIGRVYPFGDLLTQVLGYATIDNVGQAGIEAYYDKYLKGTKGKSLIQANAQGKELENSLAYYIPSVPGLNVGLSIDVQIQSILEQAINTAYVEHQAKSVLGIVLDAETGGILAMSNKPSFDLNTPPRDDVSLLNELTKNTSVVDVYEPGSTFKIFTLVACLNEGLVDLDDRFYCGGSCTVDGQKIKCWRTIGHGSQTLVEGFKNSCNCVFVNLALRLGKEKFYKYLNAFGLGQKTNVDISAESSGILMNLANVTNNDLARIGFGHSVAVTPLQMVACVNGIVSGSFKTPHLLEYMTDAQDGSIVYRYKQSDRQINLKQQTISDLLSMLSININGYDGKLTYIPGYAVGGKTGTAQKYENGAVAQGKYISSFVGVYPTTQPKYILIVAVNEPKGAYYGGVVASPIGKKVFSDIFAIKNISPDDPEQITNTADVEMPHLVGMTLADACAELTALGLYSDIGGDGEYVVAQSPVAHTMLYADETVVLMTE